MILILGLLLSRNAFFSNSPHFQCLRNSKPTSSLKLSMCFCLIMTINHFVYILLRYGRRVWYTEYRRRQAVFLPTCRKAGSGFKQAEQADER